MNKKVIGEILSNYPDRRREYLIPILQDIQDLRGFITRDDVSAVGNHLNLPAGKIYGVATFYNQFKFKSPGEFNIKVCRGTACHVKGSHGLLDTIIRELGIRPGETTRDGLFSLEIVACLGACGLAPVVCLNGEFFASMTLEKVKTLIENCRKEAGK